MKQSANTAPPPRLLPQLSPCMSISANTGARDAQVPAEKWNVILRQQSAETAPTCFSPTSKISSLNMSSRCAPPGKNQGLGANPLPPSQCVLPSLLLLPPCNTNLVIAYSAVPTSAALGVVVVMGGGNTISWLTEGQERKSIWETDRCRGSLHLQRRIPSASFSHYLE